ncbi:MAG: Smr/MutS family protein [Syntrophomonadaceae bacterium]|nr:Smr/MutS family protein [Syntrophomonadaceae bacterium]
MKVEQLNLHGLNVEEAVEKTRNNLQWCMNHGVEVLDINHGKGHHSDRGFSVIKMEIRKILRQEESLKENGYKVVHGESDLPVALGFDEGHTLVVAAGKEKEYLGGSRQQEKNRQLYSDEARKNRKHYKAQKATKSKRHK